MDWTCFNALAQKQDKSDPFPDNPSKDSLDLSYQVILAIKGIETISDAKTLGSTPLELSSRFDFITILLFSQERNASDPRDKVFGMLGILNQGMKMDPDYEKTAEEVYMELTVNFFERTKRLDHLQLAGYGIRSNDAEITLPTWALDLRAGSSIISLPLSAAFNADGEDEVIGVSFNTSLRELAVQAVVLDELEISSGAQIWMETNLNQMLKWKKLVDVRKVNPAPAGVPFLQAFYRVMIPDHAHLDEYGVFGFTLHFYIHMFQNLGVDIHNLQFPDFEVFKRQVMEPFPGGEGASVFEVYFGRPPAPEDTIGSLEYVYHYAHRIRFPWCLNVHMFCSGHYFFITDRGYMGIGPIEIKRGDHLAVISGCNLPMVLRKCSIGKYQLMGPCYVFGLMNGEVVRLTQEGNIHWESIILI